MISLEDALIGARFLWGLPRFVRRPIGLAEARETLRRRLERREAGYLALIKRTVYANPRSPYRQLLAMAGCEHGDLERLVKQEGLEGALLVLLRGGVCLSSDELKGHRPLVRGSTRLDLDPRMLRNPLARAQLKVQTSGSSGARVTVPFDFEFMRAGAVNDLLALAAAGGQQWKTAIWKVPGGDAIATLLRSTAGGAPPTHWYSQVDPVEASLPPAYAWSARLLRFGSARGGVRLPRPRFVHPDDPRPILRWMIHCLRSGCTPLLHTFVSAAVRVCQAALQAGEDLRGARFLVGGEPLTAARSAVIRQVAGELPLPRYATGEAGIIGFGCLKPSLPDEVHVFHDRLALVQSEAGSERLALPAQGIFVTSLLATAPLILLNASLGDAATLDRRACDCALAALGWTTHLHTIRGHDKLTAGGMTFFDSDVMRVLDEELPRRFGGSPTDYQLVEDEGDAGEPRLRLLVHPRIGDLEGEAVRQAFLAAISAGSGAERIMGLVWRQAELLQVERREPLSTASGKILHLHHQPRPPTTAQQNTS